MLITKEELMLEIATIVCALDDHDGPAIESSLYLYMESNIVNWMIVRSCMLRLGLITITNHLVSITDAGRKMAREISDACDKADKQTPPDRKED